MFSCCFFVYFPNTFWKSTSEGLLLIIQNGLLKAGSQHSDLSASVEFPAWVLFEYER